MTQGGQGGPNELHATGTAAMTAALQMPPNSGAERAIAEALGLVFTPPAPLPPPLPKQPAQNFVARHWRGELSLARSYWVNHVMLGGAVGLAVALIALAIDRGAVEQPVRWLISLGLTWSVISVFSIWAAVGIWRAATAYRRAGKHWWGAAAKLTVVLGTIQLASGILTVAMPQAAAICEILSGDTRLGTHQFKVMANGTMLDFSGSITFGTARELEMMLKAMDGVTTVRLNSGGGRVAEAQKMSDLIRARGLSTYVTRECESACTIVFLGGKQRFLYATAKLGFHQPWARGMSERDRRIAIAQEQERLQALFGLSRGFAERANTASPSGMWYPDQAELLRERVVTSIVMPKPVVASQPAPAARTAPAMQAVQAAWQGVPL